MKHDGLHQHTPVARRPSKVVFALLTFLVSIIVTLAAAELLIRLADPPMNYAYMPQQIYVSHYRPSSFLPSELRPNNRSSFKMLEFDTTVVTNSMGLRDNEVNFTKPRIICLGDSFTFGFGVENEETFCSALERLFEGKYDFLNAGFADGFAPDTYALWLSRYVKEFSPVAIIACLFQNDMVEVNANTWLRHGQVMTLDDQELPDKIEKKGFIITEDGAGIRDSPIAKLPPSIRRLIKRSYLIAFLRDRFLHDIEWQAWSYRAHGDQPQQEGKFIRSLDLLREATGDRFFAFYLIPAPGQTSFSHMDEVVIRYGATHQVPVFSNFADFTKADYFQLDSHFLPGGHLKAARYLHKALTNRGL